MDSPPSPARAVFGRTQFFPFAPLPYLSRVCQYWQLLHLEFIPLDRRHRLIVRVYEAHLELMGLLIYCDPPPSPSPRGLVDSLLILTRMICRDMDKNRGMLRPSGVLDLVGQVYPDAAPSSLGRDVGGSRRHLVDFSCPRPLTVPVRVDTPLDWERAHWEPTRPAQPPAFSLWRGFVFLWHLSPILFACVL